jgi:bifunctional enzyme CysN/CysC
LTSLPLQEPRSLLRFTTAGSVDDGKSTLIGRLLYDSQGMYEDEIAAIARRSEANNCKFDTSLLTDGLKAEREQGITIDVAYRYFSTPRRKFIIADTPGHEQYTRNMVTGASTAQAAVLLMDARKGLLPQTRRHACIASLLGIKTVIVALNKMDLVGFDPAIFQQTREAFLQFAAPLQFHEIRFVPISALEGDNVISRSVRMQWFDGKPLLETLESLQISENRVAGAFRFPVQLVIRNKDDFRGYAGQIASGSICPRQAVLVLPSGNRATIRQVLKGSESLRQGFAPMSVVLSLDEHTDLGRGDMLCDVDQPPAQVKRFRAKLIWMSPAPLQQGQPYLIRHTTQMACMTVLRLFHRVDIGTLEPVTADSLQLNEIGEAEIEVHKPLFCDSYSVNRATGAFTVIHPIHNTTLAAGIISEVQGYPANGNGIPTVGTGTTGSARGLTVWFTGLSGAGKTTISEAVYTELLARGIAVEPLDVDIVRKHLTRDLGFSESERNENVRRIGFVARLLTRNRVVVLVSAISPYRAVRDEIRAGIGRFIEVFVNAPLEVCERRDPKGLYKRVRANELSGFTGIDDPYEAPLSPEIECRTDAESIKESVDKVMNAILLAL